MGIQQKVTALPLKDDAIIALYFARDEQAIDETDRKYGRYLTEIAYTILKSEGDSDECRNDTYVKAWNSMPPTKPDILSAYLAKIIRSLAIGKWRQDRRQKRVPPKQQESFDELEGLLSVDNSVEAALDSKLIADAINAYLKEADKRSRYIFLSRYYYLRPIKSIAAFLGVSVSTVNKTLSAAKNKLRKHLESEGIIV